MSSSSSSSSDENVSPNGAGRAAAAAVSNAAPSVLGDASSAAAAASAGNPMRSFPAILGRKRKLNSTMEKAQCATSSRMMVNRDSDLGAPLGENMPPRSLLQQQQTGVSPLVSSPGLSMPVVVVVGCSAPATAPGVAGGPSGSYSTSSSSSGRVPFAALSAFSASENRQSQQQPQQPKVSSSGHQRVTASSTSKATLAPSGGVSPATAEQHPKAAHLASSCSPSSRRPSKASTSGSGSAVSSRGSLSEDEEERVRNQLTNVIRLSAADDAEDKPDYLPCGRNNIRLRDTWSKFREFVNETPLLRRSCAPIPDLSWADKQQMWDLMCKKESGMYRRPSGDELLLRHHSIQARMRSILFDWMIEVCEVYRLHRETFYLAADFVDRYLGLSEDLPKTRLQLLGVTCLFIASKIEEIYPPKIQEFAFVTDGACTESEIVKMELVTLKKLNWGLSPMTANKWTKIFMQVNGLSGGRSARQPDGHLPQPSARSTATGRKRKRGAMLTAEEPGGSPSAGSSSSSGRRQRLDLGQVDDQRFVHAQYREADFVEVMKLMDLVILDVGSLSFSYSVLAASAIYHCQDLNAALHASGYSLEDLNECIEWMAPFALTAREFEAELRLVKNKPYVGVPAYDKHNIQTHHVELEMLSRVHERQQEAAAAAAADAAFADEDPDGPGQRPGAASPEHPAADGEFARAVAFFGLTTPPEEAGDVYLQGDRMRRQNQNGEEQQQQQQQQQQQREQQQREEPEEDFRGERMTTGGLMRLEQQRLQRASSSVFLSPGTDEAAGSSKW